MAGLSLREENDLLRARIAEFEEILSAMELVAPAEWGLTPSQARVFALLARRDAVSHESLRIACVGPAGSERGDSLVKVHVSKLRRKIKPHGYGIAVIWGQGYRLIRPAQVSEADRIIASSIEAIADACTATLRAVGREMRRA